jgi:16S rRNA (guanine527-N7)-methyltransferase
VSTSSGPEDQHSDRSPAGIPAGLAVAAVPPELADAAATVFGDRLPIAVRYAELLATAGVERGLIGPREAPRLWDRHLVNCAVVGDLIEPGTPVIDVGSGAGLPGLVLAIARPDLHLTLVEPLLRRTTFLSESIADLGLSNVDVVRGRAEEVKKSLTAPVVTARAVAPLDRLAGWCMPLVSPGGRLLALKGSSAEAEVLEHAAALRRAGGGPPRIFKCGKGIADPPTVVVEVPLLNTPPHSGGRHSRQGK